MKSFIKLVPYLQNLTSKKLLSLNTNVYNKLKPVLKLVLLLLDTTITLSV